MRLGCWRCLGLSTSSRCLQFFASLGSQRTACWLGQQHLLALPRCSFRCFGIAVFLFVGLPFFGILQLINGGSPLAAATPPTWVDKAIDGGCWTTIAIIVGVVVGFFLHALRPGGTTDHLPLTLPHHPRMRSDVSGAAVAAFLAFGAMFVSLPFGLFSRPIDIPADWMHQFSEPPTLSATVVIGIAALLPHLIMVGTDLFLSRSATRGDEDRCGGINKRCRILEPCNISWADCDWRSNFGVSGIAIRQAKFGRLVTHRPASTHAVSVEARQFHHCASASNSLPAEGAGSGNADARG